MTARTERRLTVGIPTRDRPAELAGLLALLDAERPSLEAAGWAVEVLVADGSAVPAAPAGPAAAAGRPAAAGPARPAGVRVLPVTGGVSTGRNAVAAAATGDVLILVDDDVRPRPGSLAALAAAVRPGTAVAGRVAGLGHAPGERSGAGVLTRTGFGAPVPPGCEPDYLVSALLALPPDVYARLRWDERYAAAHLDDLAFGLRLRAAGVALRVCDEATAEHPARPRRRDPALAGHRAALVATRYPGEPLTRLRALAHTVWEHRASPPTAVTAARSFLRGLPGEAVPAGPGAPPAPLGPRTTACTDISVQPVAPSGRPTPAEQR